MLAIVGLGNPGEKYEHTRHNAGFDVVSILSAKWDIPLKKLKCKALLGEGVVGGQKVVLIKPQTYMNESGLSVAEALNWYKLDPKEMLIVVDDIDLPFGQVRVRAGATTGCAASSSARAAGTFPGSGSAWARRPLGGTWRTMCWAILTPLRSGRPPSAPIRPPQKRPAAGSRKGSTGP